MDPILRSNGRFNSSSAPLLLPGDRIHHSKVTGTLGFFTRDDPELAPLLKTLREAFQRLDPNRPESLGYSAQVRRADGDFSQQVSDTQLASAWLYGDLVHTSELVPPIDDHDLNARYEVAVLFIANVAVTKVSVLNLLRRAIEADLLELDESLFTESLAARGSYRLPATSLITAPAGTPPDVLINAVGTDSDASEDET